MKHKSTFGGAIIYALVFAALLGLTGLAILATQARSSRNTGAITERALERATAEAAVEHGKALVQQAIGAHMPLEQLADLDVNNDQLNRLEYKLDLSLAAYGDVRADLVGTREWAAARLDPLTGVPLRHLTSNVNIEALTLQGEWRDALVHESPGNDPITLGIHQDGVFTKPTLDAGIPILASFPALNAPPAQIAARGSTSGARTELGILLDATGRVWEWPLDESNPPTRLEDLAGVTSITAGDRFALALTEGGALYAWGYNMRGPLRPTSGSFSETLHTPTRVSMPQEKGSPPTLLSVAAGSNHVVALDTQGRVWTWGANDNLQTGRSCGSVCSAAILEIPTPSQIVSVSAGGNRGAALDQSGQLFVWGDGNILRLLAYPGGVPVRVSHYSLGGSEGLAVTRDAELVAFTGSTAQPLELAIITTEDGRRTTVTRADLLRAGDTHHAAIIGSALFTWPAGATGTTITASRNAAPGDRPPLTHDDLDSVRVTPGDQTLTLTWAAPEGEELTYEIHHARDARNWTLAGQTASPAYHLSGLTNGQPHYLRLTATNPYGELVREHESGPYTPAGPPSPPRNGKTTPLHEALELTWDAPHNNGNPITHYRLEQSTNGTVWQTLPYEPTEPMARVTGLENGRAYHHRVTAVNSAGRSQPHTLPIGTPSGPPAPPVLESVNGHAQDGQPAITLTWQPTRGATSYRANYTRDGSTWASRASTGNSVTITGLEHNATYRVNLVAVNHHGDSQPSRTESVTTSGAPSSPRDLTALPRGDTQALIAWNAPTSGAPISNYRLERRDEDGAWRRIATPAGETHTDEGLEPGREYAYRVAAVNTIGIGAYTAPVDLVTALTPPGQPGAPKLLFRNQDSLTISWEAPTSTGGSPSLTYRLERRPADQGTWTALEQRHDSTTYTDHTAQAGRTYTYRVIASNKEHDSQPSEEALIAAADALSAPDRPRVTGREHLTISLEWDASTTPSVTAYVIERAEEGSTFTTHATVPAQTPAVQTYVDTRVTAGQTYTYRLRAQTPDATSDPGPASQDVTALATSSAPRDLSAQLNLETGQFELTWAEPTDTGGSRILGYRIQRNTNQQSWVTIIDTMNAAQDFIDTSAELGQEHSYRVAAFTSLGVNHHGPYTAATPAQLAIHIPKTPAAPTVTTAPGSFTHPLITWLAPFEGGTPITTYTLERETAGTWREHATVAGHETQYVDYDAQPGRSYRYRVTAHNAAGASHASSPSSTYEAHPALDAPAPPSVTHAGTAHLRVSWAPPATANPDDVQGYRLERRAGNGAWEALIANTGPSKLSHDDRGLSVGVAYQYRVAAINQAGVTGEPSTASAAIVAAQPPSAPKSASATRSGDRKITVEWSAPSSDGHAPVTSYKLQARTSTDDSTWGGWSTIYEGGNRTYTHDSLNGPLYYQYRVMAVNATGESPAVQTASMRAQEARTIAYAFTYSGGTCTFNVRESTVVPGDSQWHTQTLHPRTGSTCSAQLTVAVTWDQNASSPQPQCRIDGSSHPVDNWRNTECRFE